MRDTTTSAARRLFAELFAPGGRATMIPARMARLVFGFGVLKPGPKLSTLL
jgi:hypothetical protein